MENIKNDMQMKLTDYFKERLKYIETKSIEQLRDLELLKYESYLILNEENQEESEEINLDKYKEADLFLSYFNRDSIYQKENIKIDKVEEFSIFKVKEIKEKSTNSIFLNKLIQEKKENNKNEIKTINNKLNNLKYSSKDSNFNRSPQGIQNKGSLKLEKTKIQKECLNLFSYNNDNNNNKKSKKDSVKRNNLDIKDKLEDCSNEKLIPENEGINIKNDKEEIKKNYGETLNLAKIEVQRNNSYQKEENSLVDKNNINNKRNFVCNNVLYESVSNSSNIHNDSFFRNENLSKNILDTEINEINYVLTEANDQSKGKRIFSKQNKSKNNYNKENNFIEKVREALNFSNTIRNTHLITNRINNNNINQSKDAKNTDSSFYNSNNINNVSIYSKKENHASGNQTKKLVNIPYLDSNTIVKDNSPIANMINEYFDKLEGKQIGKNLIEGKDPNNINNIINIGCANFISNNINNNFSKEKVLKNLEDKEILNKIELQNKGNEDAFNNRSLSVDKVNENLNQFDNQKNFKSPEFGYEKKWRSIIKVKKPQEELKCNIVIIDPKVSNAKNLINELDTIENDAILNANKDLKEKLRLNLNEINEKTLKIPSYFGNNTSRNKTLSYDTDKMDFYLSQKNFKKRNYIRDNIREKHINTSNENKKTQNNLIDAYLRKQAQIKKNTNDTYKIIDVNLLSSRSKTLKNISIKPNQQSVKSELDSIHLKSSLENPNFLLDKKPLNLKNARDNKKRLSENTNQISENISNLEKKIVIFDNIETNKNNKIANEIQINEEDIEKNIKLDDNIHHSKQNLINQLDFGSNDLKINKDVELNKNEKIEIRAISNEKELVTKNNPKILNPVEHRKNFSFGASYYEKLNEKNSLNKKIQIINQKSIENQGSKKNNFVTNNSIKQDSFNSNLKINASMTNNLNNSISNKKRNSTSTNNKKEFASEGLNKKGTMNKKLSLEIRTDLIDCINEIEVNKILPESTRISVNMKNSKFEINQLNKINTTKNFSKNKIELIPYKKKEDNKELKNSVEVNNRKHQKTYSKDNFSTNLNLVNNKDKNHSTLKNKNNEVSKENEVNKSSVSLDKKTANKNKIRENFDNKKIDKNTNLENKGQEDNKTKKLTKNLSIINEKENSPLKQNGNYNSINNKKLIKIEKNIRKNFSVDLDNLNTSISKDNDFENAKKSNKSRLQFITKNKELKKEDDKEIKEISSSQKPDKKDYSINNKKISKSKEKVDKKIKDHEKFDKKKEKPKQRKSKSVIIDDNIKAEENLNKLINIEHKEIENKQSNENETSLIKDKYERRRSHSIHNKNNNLIIDYKEESKTDLNNPISIKTENNLLPKRSISNERKISLKRNSNIEIKETSYLTNENLIESEKKNKRKNAFKNDEIPNDPNDKDKESNTQQENRKGDNPPKRNILKNKLKKTSLVEIEKDIPNNKKMSLTKNKNKDELKSEKDLVKTKKSLKGEEKEKLSTAKVRKIIRPNNLKNKINQEKNENENEENKQLKETDQDHNEDINANLANIGKESDYLQENKVKEESVEEQHKTDEIKIDPIQFDNMIKNITIADDALFKSKCNIEEKHIENEALTISTNSNLGNIELKTNNEYIINQNEKDSSTKEKIAEKDEAPSNDVDKENKSNEQRISFTRKITFDINEHIIENVKEDLTHTPNFSPLLYNRNISENKLNTAEQTNNISNNLQQQFNEIKVEEKKINSIPIADYILVKIKSKKRFNNRKEEIMNIVFNSSFLSLEKKIFLFKIFKPLRYSMSEEEIKQFKIRCLKEKISLNDKILNKYIEEPEYKGLITEPLKPSKTAKNGLSLFSKDEENNLINKEQPKEIINFFKFLALLFNKDIKEEEIIENNFIKTFFNFVIPENMTLKTFFIETSNNIYLIDDKNFDLIHSFIKEFPEVIKSTELLRKNRTCSYMSFLVKEIYDYYSAKATDGFYIYKLRNLYRQTLRLKETLENEINKVQVEDVNENK